jgi:hypothetical protein
MAKNEAREIERKLPKHAPKKTGRAGIGPVPDAKPKQARLAGFEDAKIEALEAGAEEYVSARDKRMALTEVEVEAKAKLLRLMHDSGRSSYTRNGYSITVVPEGEKIRVKIKHEEEDE